MIVHVTTRYIHGAALEDTHSLSEQNRQQGVHQVEERRESILNAAQRLFLARGLEIVSMVDIAEAAGITKVTLYRYFPSKDPIAFDIAVRMLKKVAASSQKFDGELTLANIKRLCQSLVSNFYRTRDAYRYLGMFEHIYAENYPSEELAQFFKQSIFLLEFNHVTYKDLSETFPQAQQVMMLINTIMAFLQKMALRGELLEMEQELPMDDQLRMFRDMIGMYFDRLIQIQETT
jgi:AcrR family transcriptional regulator